MKNNKGFIGLDRGIFDSPIWKERRTFSRAEAWIDLINLARYSDESEIVMIKDREIECHRGQLIRSMVTLGDRWGWSKSKVKRVLDVFAKRNMIVIENATVTTRLTLCNYDTYNPLRNAKGTIVKRKQNDRKTQTDTEEQGSNKEETKKKQSEGSQARPNSPDQVIDYCLELGLLREDGEAVWDKWNGNGWRNGNAAIKCWKSTIRSWKAQGYMPSQKNPSLKKTATKLTQKTQW